MKLMNNKKNRKTRFFKAAFFVVLFTFILYFIFYITGIHTLCYTKAFTGFPCPGCGMTRAYLALFHLDFKSAFYYHPLFLLPVVVVILQFIQFKTGFKFSKWIWVLLLLLLLFTYVIRMILYFPNREPMTYDETAYLPRLLRMIFSLLK